MEQAIHEILEKMKDGWFILAMVAQACFFSRFAVQWIVSEKNKKSVVPVSFWYLSMIGCTGLLIYGFARREPILIIGQFFNNIIYIRNLMLIRKHAKTIEAEA